MKVLLIIQARMNSSRLPGKVLRLINKKPLLWYLVENIRQSLVPNFVVATSEEPTDTPIKEFCDEQQICCFRGDLNNVAKRFYDLLTLHDVDAFIRISGDSPLLDYRLVNSYVNLFCSSPYDVITNIFPRSFPKGQSVELIRRKVFMSHFEKINTSFYKEHVTPFFYDHSNHFSIYNLKAENNFNHIQLSVDSDEDFRLISQTIFSMEKPHWTYSWKEILEIREQIIKVKNEQLK